MPLKDNKLKSLTVTQVKDEVDDDDDDGCDSVWCCMVMLWCDVVCNVTSGPRQIEGVLYSEAQASLSVFGGMQENSKDLKI